MGWEMVCSRYELYEVSFVTDQHINCLVFPLPEETKF